MKEEPIIVPANPAEWNIIASLFRDTVRFINSADYDAEQIQVWASAADDSNKWLEKICGQLFEVARLQDEIVGFGSMTSEGYLDLLYVHANYQGKGIGAMLLKKMEYYISDFATATTIYCDASITARTFFEKHGYKVEARQEVMRGSVSITNFRMSKVIK